LSFHEDVGDGRGIGRYAECTCKIVTPADGCEAEGGTGVAERGSSIGESVGDFLDDAIAAAGDDTSKRTPTTRRRLSCDTLGVTRSGGVTYFDIYTLSVDKFSHDVGSV
jgi:hypothetical protein